MTFRIGSSSFLWSSGAALTGTATLPATAFAPTAESGYLRNALETADAARDVHAHFPGPFFARSKGATTTGGSGGRTGGSGSRHIRSMIQELGSEDAALRHRTMAALVTIGEPAVDPLIRALRNPCDLVRACAVRTLAQIGDERAVPELVQRFDESKFPILQAVYEALEAFGARAIPALTASLNDPNPKVRGSSAMMLGEIEDTSAVAPLLGALENAGEEDIKGIAEALSRLGDPIALTALRHLLQRDLEAGVVKTVKRAIEKLEGISESTAQASPSLVDMAEDITSHLRAGLGLSKRIGVRVGDVESYGSITATGRLALQQVPNASQRQELFDLDAWLSVDQGADEKAGREMMQALNFLVHHEIAHLLQEERSIPKPAVDEAFFELFDEQRTLTSANETMIDKLALLTARKIYVAAHGDVLFSEDMREAISINAAIILYEGVLRRHRSGERPMAQEEKARASAVLLEMVRRDAIGKHTKRNIKRLADAFCAIAITGYDRRELATFRRLIEVYREIYRSTNVNL
jgi:HEAT repeat protein